MKHQQRFHPHRFPCAQIKFRISTFSSLISGSNSQLVSVDLFHRIANKVSETLSVRNVACDSSKPLVARKLCMHKWQNGFVSFINRKSSRNQSISQLATLQRAFLFVCACVFSISMSRTSVCMFSFRLPFD